ncbi:hypothetical protein [Streptomyces pactum]|uniref:hypothetical protein n=1 Tax=Streptomyces pactum TaxID=68249 RepID=UPI0035590B4A
MTARRPLLTAAAAGSMLCALWFVPSADATEARGGEGPAGRSPAYARQVSGPATGGDSPVPSPGGPDLADSGSVDVTPYVVGGVGFLGLGVAMVTASMRRPRSAAY